MGWQSLQKKSKLRLPWGKVAGSPTHIGWKRQWQDVQKSEGIPMTPGQWIEHGNIVFFVGRMILEGGRMDWSPDMAGRCSLEVTACMLGYRFC